MASENDLKYRSGQKSQPRATGQGSKTTISVMRSEEIGSSDKPTIGLPSKRAQVDFRMSSEEQIKPNTPSANAFSSASKKHQMRRENITQSRKTPEMTNNQDIYPQYNLPQDSGHNVSFEKNAGKPVRPRSAAKDQSRDYGNNHSQYSSVYTRILNPGEVKKIKRLIGENNPDLDV